MPATTEQQPTPPDGAQAQPCASCGAPLAPDQRYCLSCGTRHGEPRVAPAVAATAPEAKPEPQGRPADVSPLAAVIGIALLGGMLLIGVLIGRGGTNDESQPAPIVQVGEATQSSGAPSGSGGGSDSSGVTSEWPQGTDGFTIQITTLSKDGATPESVDAATLSAVSDGAADAAALDSDLYPSLPPGNYVIYSGVFTDRKSAEVALKGLSKSFPTAAVVEVSDRSGQTPSPDPIEPPTTGSVPPAGDDTGAVIPGAGGEQEVPPDGGK